MSFNTYQKEFKSIKPEKTYNNGRINQEMRKELTIDDLPF